MVSLADYQRFANTQNDLRIVKRFRKLFFGVSRKKIFFFFNSDGRHFKNNVENHCIQIQPHFPSRVMYTINNNTYTIYTYYNILCSVTINYYYSHRSDPRVRDVILHDISAPIIIIKSRRNDDNIMCLQDAPTPVRYDGVSK